MRKEYTIFLFLLFGVITIIVLRKLYTKYKKKRIVPQYSANGANGKVKTCEMIYFYTTWCPYCKKAQPEWTAFRNEWEGVPCKGYYITFTEVDCDVDESTAKKYNVKSYPTIILKCEGEVVEYDARPTKEDLNKFVDSVLPESKK